MVKPYTMIIHPNTLQHLEQELGRICIYTTGVDAEGAATEGSGQTL